MIYTILGISIYLFGQFIWLKSFKYFSKKYFLITLIVPTILIFSNFFEVSNAIHTICWLPYLLLVLIILYLKIIYLNQVY